MKVRKHVIFSGRVQGVGFRYRAYYAARALGLTGWVRNNYDDTVEMEVEGEELAIYELFGRLRNGTFIYIDNIDEKNIDLVNDSSFNIR